MEPYIHELLTDDFLKKAQTLFGLDRIGEKLGDFENFVFEVEREGKPAILRLTHSSHREKGGIVSELDWMNFLHANGVHVPEAFQSIDGELVAQIGTSPFSAVLFSKVQGKAVSVQAEQFDSPLFFTWGKTIGKMHQVTKTYEVPDGIKRRPRWNEDDLILNFETYLPDCEKQLVTVAAELLGELHRLPTSKEFFNLIHGDVHSGNFFYDGQDIHVFDFDDCSYHWLTSDIAIPVYYSALFRYPEGQQDERNEFAKKFLDSFLQGYESVTALPPQWKEHLPLMMRLRDLLLYAVLHKKIHPEQRTEQTKQMMDAIRERIENRVPLIHF
ncbi:phosphotransferase enzyme family protein [Neobacillus sp. Marseille-QA0830]